MKNGTHDIGPSNGTLQVKTYRAGMAQKAGHDLVMEVTSWKATVEVPEGSDQLSVDLSADPRSLQVRSGTGGAKSLSDKDRKDIEKNIDDKVLKGQALTFRGTGAGNSDGGPVTVSGELEMGGKTQAVSFEVEVGPDGQVKGTVPLTQSDWGIKPYSAMMGALKVKDELEVVLDAQLPAG